MQHRRRTEPPPGADREEDPQQGSELEHWEDEG